VTKLSLKTSENLPENTNKEAFYRTAIQIKYSYKTLNCIKKLDILKFECPFWGVMKLKASQWCLVTRLYPPNCHLFGEN
jgi:hypothetical protein